VFCGGGDGNGDVRPRVRAFKGNPKNKKGGKGVGLCRSRRAVAFLPSLSSLSHTPPSFSDVKYSFFCPVAVSLFLFSKTLSLFFLLSLFSFVSIFALSSLSVSSTISVFFFL
jgi:hypothetical protein